MKYLLLKHYRGDHDIALNPLPPATEWDPPDFDAHVAFMRQLNDEFRERGEFVDAQGLSPEGTFVRYDGEGKPPVTDGPFAETKDLIAGWYILDVESEERAYEAAARVSSAPGPGGEPIYEWIEVRQIMSAPAPKGGGAGE